MDNTSEKKCCNFEIVEGGITRKDLFGKVTSSRHDLFILAKTAKKAEFLWDEVFPMLKAKEITQTEVSSVHFSHDFGQDFFGRRVEESLWQTPGIEEDRTFGEIMQIK